MLFLYFYFLLWAPSCFSAITAADGKALMALEVGEVGVRR